MPPSLDDKTQLRFITCGSVDDGKSTLIGRLLYDSKAVLDDQLSSLETDSKAVGTRGDQIDFALLVDVAPAIADTNRSPPLVEPVNNVELRVDDEIPLFVDVTPAVPDTNCG